MINIVTFNPQYDDIKAERASVGSDGSQSASVVRTAHWADGGIRLSGGWNKDSETDFHPYFAGDRLAAADPSINRTVNLDAQMAPDEQSRLRLQGAITDGGMRGMYLMPFYINLMLATGQLDYSRDSDFGHFDASVMHNRFSVGQYRNSLAVGSLSSDVSVAKLQDRFKIGSDDTIRIGAEYRRDEMPTFPLQGSSLLSQDAALSGLWTHVITDDVTVLNALREDRFWLQRSGPLLAGTPWTNGDYDRSITDWSFNSAVVWRPSALDSLKLSAARGLTLPSLLEFGIMNPLTVPFAPPYIPTAQLLSVGNPTLEPTKVTHYELSWDHALADIAGSAKLAVYHQLVQGLRDFSATTLIAPPPAPVLLSTYVNSGGVHLNGLEMDLKGHFNGAWRWGLNYSAETVTADTAGDQFHDFSRSTPHHKANVSLGWTAGSWEGDSMLRYVSASAMPQQTAFGVYSLTPIKATIALSQRLAYAVTPSLRIEATGYSAFNDNPTASEKRRVLLSVIANY